MTASDLTEWIALFQPSLSSDGAGGMIETEPTGLSADYPAHVRQVSGSAIGAGDQSLADRVRYVITTRYEPGINTAWRVAWREMLLDITGVRVPDTAFEYLELMCERKEAGAQ